MRKSLQVLVIEDSQDDTDLLVRELRRGGYDPSYKRVENAETMQAALVGRAWDIVVADYSMPRFSAPAALALLKENELDIPFIIVSGTIGEERAVAAMKAGAHDYLMKGHLARLVPVVERELREAQMRRESRKAEAEVYQRNRELALLNQIIAASATGLEPEAILDIACQGLAMILELPRATGGLFNETKTKFVKMAEYFRASSDDVLAENQPSRRQTVTSVAASPSLQQIIADKTPLVITNAQNDAPLIQAHDLLHQPGAASILVLPLLIEDKVAGVLSLETTEVRHFFMEEINLAISVVDQIAGALAQARLAQTRQRLSAAIEQVAEGVIITDSRGIIVYVNSAFERMSGYSRAEAKDQNLRLFNSDQHDDRTFYENLWTTISAGEVWHGRFDNKRKDGSLYTEDATITPVRDKSGVIVNYVAVKRDVTQELKMEERYRQSQKMEAIGQLSGGVAHDFNNLLVVIIGYGELLLTRHLKPDSPAHRYVEEIRKAGERATRLTQQLMAFSRRQVLELKALNLNEVVADTEMMLRRLISEDIELITHLDPELGQIKVDPGQIEQVIMNMVINARDAMPNGGKLVIETAGVELDEAYTREYPDINPGQYVMLAVSDTGLGMDKSTLSHIFEPFFTTKEQGKGTGLGLATVYGIVKQSGGDILVSSEPGQGTVFKIYLPQVDEAVDVTESSLSQRDLSEGQETILLVEDEMVVRDFVRRVLEASGYTVFEASHGGEALQLFEQLPETVHLLITDVVMPGGMNGSELAEQLKRLRPELKVLYISGYTNDTIAEYGVLEAGIHFLQKPFTPNALDQKVRQVLDELSE